MKPVAHGKEALRGRWPRDGAVLSDDGKYRYLLTRSLGQEGRACLFVMLNPSTADAKEDDPTIRKCCGFARRWGCGQLIVVNLFAFRATHPSVLWMQGGEKIGPANDEWIIEAAGRTINSSGIVIAAWGIHGHYQDRDKQVYAMLRAAGKAPLCIGVAAGGQPLHPLMQPYASRLRMLSTSRYAATNRKL